MTTVFLGRFQPLHNGHHHAIKTALDKHEDLKIVIGSADKSGTEKNPLTAEERKDIIKECFPKVETLSLEDDESDKVWIEKLEELQPETVISGNERVRNIVEEFTDWNIEKPEMFHPEIYSGTEVRRRIKSDEEWRYLVPECSKKKLETYIETIKSSGIQYEFEPGWKRENASHGTTK